MYVPLQHGTQHILQGTEVNPDVCERYAVDWQTRVSTEVWNPLEAMVMSYAMSPWGMTVHTHTHTHTHTHYTYVP